MSTHPGLREYPDCICGCGVQGVLTKREPQHARGCTCRSCQGYRNRKRGQASQSKGYKRLGGRANRSPSQEEWAEVFTVPLKIENKAGYPLQTTKLRAYVRTTFFLNALSQAERAISIGTPALPAVRHDFGRDGVYIVVKETRKRSSAT